MCVPSTQGGWKTSSDPLELELWTTIWMLGTKLEVLCKNKCSSLLFTRHLSSSQYPWKSSKISKTQKICSHASSIYFPSLSIPTTSRRGFQAVSPHRTLSVSFLMIRESVLFPWPFEMMTIGDGERLSSCEYLLILQRTQVYFLAPTASGSQMPLTLASGDQTSLASGDTYHTHTQTHTE